MTASANWGSTSSLTYRSSSPIRRPRTPWPNPANMSGTGAVREVGSLGSRPAMACRMVPASAALRVIGPTWSNDAAKASTP